MRSFRIAFPALLTALAVALFLPAVPTLAEEGDDIDTLNREAAKLFESKKYGEALVPAQRALELAEQQLGPDHKRVGKLLGNIGVLHWQQSHYGEAESFYRRSLTVLAKALGPESKEAGTTLSTLCRVAAVQKHYAEAEDFCRRALPVEEKAFGPETAEVGNTVLLFAGVYNIQRKFEEAGPLYQRALAIKEKTLGPDDPRVADLLKQMGWLFGQYQGSNEAKPLFARGLAIMEKAKGADSEELLPWLDGLAHFGGAEAEAVYLRELAILEKAHGPDHPDLAKVLNKLGEFYASYGQNQFGKAEQTYKRGLAIVEKAYGVDGIEAAPWLNALAALFKRQDRHAEAKEYYSRALSLMEKAKGPDHPDVVAALNNLASVYTDYGQKKDAEAVPLYLRAISILEKAKGADSPDIADALHTLGLTYEALQRHADAEAIYLRALSILEKANGPDHPDLVRALDRLTSLYTFSMKQYAKAEPLGRRALAIMEKARGVDHPDTMLAISGLASVLELQHRYAEAEVLRRRALAIREKETGPDDPSLRSQLESVAEAAQRQGHYEEAERLYRRSLAIVEHQGDDASLGVRMALGKLIELYNEQARYAEAEPLMRRVFAIAEKRCNSGQPTASDKLAWHNAIYDLAKLLKTLNKTAEAETLMRLALANDEKWGGPEDEIVFNDLLSLGGLLSETNRHTEAETILRRASDLAGRYAADFIKANAFNSLAIFLRNTNRLAEAESYYRRALPMTEAFGAPDQIASILGNFAGLLQDTGRLEEAEPLLRRALAIGEKAHGADHPAIIPTLNNLAVMLEEAKRYPEAEALFRRSLAIAERTFGPEHPRVGLRLANLGALLVHSDRLAEAERLLRRALAIDEKGLGPDHPSTSSSLNKLAELLMRTGRRAEAEPLMRRALAIDEKSYGAAHPQTAVSLSNLAVLRALDGDWTEAAGLYRRAVPGSIGSQDDARFYNRTGLGGTFLRNSARDFRQHARAVYRAGGQSASAQEESFTLAQSALKSGAGDALALMSARFAKGKGPLTDAVRERQNLVDRRRAEDKRLLAATGRGDAQAGEALRNSIAELDKTLDGLDATLAEKFPDYAALTNPRPLTIAEVQGLLNGHEALILFLDVNRVGKLPGETLVWLITKQSAVQRSFPLDTDALAEQVAALRCGLDQTLWQDGKSAQKCRTLLNAPNLDPGKSPAEQWPPFDLHRAHELFQILFGPDQELIKGKDLLIVPSGPLASLPFGILVEAPSKSDGLANPAAYRSAAWLGARRPISILPSVPSLKALRRIAKTSKATKPYLGIGDPLLEGDQNDPAYGAFYRQRAKLARDKQKCQKTRSAGTRLAAGQPLAEFNKLFRGVHADIEQIRNVTPLPETADELCDVGHRLGVEDRAILLGRRASESVLKDMSEHGQLASYRVIHFATHGALAGQVQNNAEPGLILTPPAKGTSDSQALERDDGFLTASEIATLKLDADWVVLSACNTAGGASEKGEALSGMARAFFYAGARSLLVSHWAVDSEAAAKLVTGAFRVLERNPRLSHAQALQRAMGALVAAGGMEAHPAYWAPFVAVGGDEATAQAKKPVAGNDG
jgi:CHAT domain-containing protein/tetratricopeptide (TPR) repeat protein